jgi:hypothetical protein
VATVPIISQYAAAAPADRRSFGADAAVQTRRRVPAVGNPPPSIPN